MTASESSGKLLPMTRKEAIQEWHAEHAEYIAQLEATGEDKEVIDMCRKNPLIGAQRAKKILKKRS